MHLVNMITCPCASADCLIFLLMISSWIMQIHPFLQALYVCAHMCKDIEVTCMHSSAYLDADRVFSSLKLDYYLLLL